MFSDIQSCLCNGQFDSTVEVHDYTTRDLLIVFHDIGLLLYSHMPYHNDTIIKTLEDFFINICTSHFIVSLKGLLKICVWEGVGIEQNCYILTPTLMAVSVVSFSFSRSAQPEAQRPTLPAFSTALYQHLLWTPTQSGAPSPFGLVWLSLSHLVYNSVRSLTVWLLSWLSYIIVQRPLSRLLDLWNRMFDSHQVEITVMQFTSHSLSVHQSMSVPWEFFYLVPFHQPISTHAISSTYFVRNGTYLLMFIGRVYNIC